MIVLTLLFALIFIELGKDILERGYLIYRNPRFWVHITTIGLILYIVSV
jgi:hypothetical protein